MCAKEKDRIPIVTDQQAVVADRRPFAVDKHPVNQHARPDHRGLLCTAEIAFLTGEGELTDDSAAKEQQRGQQEIDHDARRARNAVEDLTQLLHAVSPPVRSMRRRTSRPD